MRTATLFTLACILGTAAATDPTPQQICAARTNTNVATADCEQMPVWATTFQTYGSDVTWKRYDVTTTEGNILGVVRITGDASNTPAAATDKGPILLTACAYFDGYAFFQLNDLTKPVVPVQLFEEGFDVWIANRRGTIHSTGSTGNLYEDDPTTYFDFDLEDVALVDYPELISYILEERRTNGLPCKKMSLYSDGHSAAEMAYMMATYPTSAGQWIAQQVQLTPCFVFEEFAVDVVVDLQYDPAAQEDNPCEEAEGDEDEGGEGYRMLQSSDKPRRAMHGGGYGHGGWSPRKSDECYATWDSREYYGRMAEIRDALSHNDYWNYSREFQQWSRDYGRDWKYGGVWQEASLRIYCQYNIEDLDCRPNAQKRFADFLELTELPSFYGPNWQEHVDLICAEWPGKACANYAEFINVSYPFGFRETSLQELVFISQNGIKRSFGRFDPDFSTQGWFAERDTYDLSTINVPIRTLFLGDDNICAQDVNLEILNTIPTFSEYVSVYDRKHFDIVGDNEDLMKYARLSLLSPNAGEMIDGDCAAIDFTNWSA